MSNLHREQAREIVTEFQEHLRQTYDVISVGARNWLTQRVASALAARDGEIKRLRRWREGLAATTVAWSEQRLSRDAEIREVLEGLRGCKGDGRCWCNPVFPNIEACHEPACLATRALWERVQER